MDFNAELQSLRSYQKRIDKEIEQAQTHLQALENRTDFPEKTDTLAKLKDASGRTVKIEIGLGKKGFETKTAVYKLENGKIVVGNGSYPITGINNHGIKSIVDAETKEVIFENPWYDENDLYVKDGLLFGKEFAIEEAKAELDYLNKEKEWTAEKLEETQKLAELVPTLIEKGEKLVFPKMAKEWERYVADNALTSSKEFQSAVELMETLSNGTLEEASKKADLIFDCSNWSKFNSKFVLNAVTTFSRQGPEFYQKMKGETPKLVQDVANQNKKFERELSGGGKQ